MFKYKFLFFLILILMIFSPVQGKMIDKVVAVINGEIVTLHELNQRLENNTDRAKTPDISQDSVNKQKRVLRSMVNNILLEQEADRLQITVSDMEVENRIDRMLESRGLSREQFEDMLEQRNISLREYKSRIKRQIKKNKLLSSMVRQKVIVTEQEIREYYRENEEKYTQSKQCKICIILMQHKTSLQNIVHRIHKGEISFELAAQKYSRGPARDKGGCLGTFKWSDMKKNWKSVIRNLHPGEVSEVVSLDKGYAAFKLDSEIKRNKTPLQEVRNKIRDKIYSEKLRSRYEKYLQDLRSEAVVEVKL